MAFGSRKSDPKFKFCNGDEVEDRITKFRGVVIGRTQWLHNCNTYNIQPQKLKDGNPQKNHIFDEPQLKIFKAEKINTQRNTGGPVPSNSSTR